MLLIWVCAAWIIGIFAGSYLHLPWIWVISGIPPLVLLIFFKKYRKSLLILGLALISLFGGLAYYPVSFQPASALLSDNVRVPLELTGVIIAPPEIRDKVTHLTLSVAEIDGLSAEGKVLLFVPLYPEYHYGDVIAVKGRLAPPPRFEDFDYPAYLAADGIYHTMLSPEIRVVKAHVGFSPLGWIYDLRSRLAASLSSVLPEPQSALAQGIVLGLRSTISPDLRNQLSVTGTAHLLAISGINLSIIAGMFVVMGIRLFGRRYYIYIWLTLALIWFYAVLTGLQAPVVRSAIMASTFLLAELLGRQKWALPALALSAAIMVGFDPQLLWSISFHLSFLAMIGLIFITPYFQDLPRNFIHNRWGEEGWAAKLILPVTDSFAVSLGAVIAIWPVVAYNFGVFSIIGPLSTFLISPALTPIIILGALTALIGSISQPLAQVLGWSAWLFLSFMLVMIKAFSALPLASVQTAAIELNWIRGYYLLLALGLYLKSELNRIKILVSALASKLAPAENLFARLPKSM